MPAPPPSAEPAPRTPRWRYVVPNAITCASLMLGLAAVAVSFIGGDFTEAAWLVVLSVLLDKLDGTVARALRATSGIGMQLDSFADFVTFGIAPGAMLFASGLAARAGGAGSLWDGTVGLTLLGVLCGGYILCTCIRLAKFNVLQEHLPAEAPPVFYGMPSTFAGGLIAITYILLAKYGAGGLLDAMPIFAGALAALMVSNHPLPKLALRRSRWINAFQFASVGLTYVFGVIRIFPEYMAFNVVGYALIGFTWGAVHRRRLLALRRLDPYPVGDEGEDHESAVAEP